MPQRARLTCTILLILVTLAVGAQTTDVIFVNRTGATIYFLYASPSSADTWGEDLLGRTVLADEATYRARLRSGASSYDVRAVDANENEYIIWGWRPGGENRIAITTDSFVGARVASSSSGALSWVTIVNDTNYAVVEIHVAPSDAGSWDEGQQVLGAGDVVHDGEDYRVDVDAGQYDTLVYDIMLVDEDGDRYIKWDVNLELQTEIVYTLDDLEWR